MNKKIMSVMRKQPEILKAIQFTKDTIDEVVDFVHGSYYQEKKIIVLYTPYDRCVAVYGDYIIRHNNGKYEILPEKEFMEKYIISEIYSDSEGLWERIR